MAGAARCCWTRCGASAGITRPSVGRRPGPPLTRPLYWIQVLPSLRPRASGDEPRFGAANLVAAPLGPARAGMNLELLCWRFGAIQTPPQVRG